MTMLQISKSKQMNQLLHNRQQNLLSISTTLEEITWLQLLMKVPLKTHSWKRTSKLNQRILQWTIFFWISQGCNKNVRPKNQTSPMISQALDHMKILKVLNLIPMVQVFYLSIFMKIQDADTSFRLVWILKSSVSKVLIFLRRFVMKCMTMSEQISMKWNQMNKLESMLKLNRLKRPSTQQSITFGVL